MSCCAITWRRGEKGGVVWMNEGGREISVLASYKIGHRAGYLNCSSLYISAEHLYVSKFAEIPHVSFTNGNDGVRRYVRLELRGLIDDDDDSTVQ